MYQRKIRAFFISILCMLTLIVCAFGVPVARAETSNSVTATTSATVTQGNSAYCYVYIDSLKDISTLSVSVYFDSEKVSISNVYNKVPCQIYDSKKSDSCVQFSYVFNNDGADTKTQLFYFRYTVKSTAPTGSDYFDIVINEAYTTDLQVAEVSGSRCGFSITEKPATQTTCTVSASSTVNSSIQQEFTLSYRLSSYRIASGSFAITYDSELFELVSYTQGNFLSNKLVDINTAQAGSVQVSFVGTEYKSAYDLISVKLKTKVNSNATSQIAIAFTDLFDLSLNPIVCKGYTTKANVVFDETYTADAPSVYLTSSYVGESIMKTTVCLDEQTHLGAGDFVLSFDTDNLVYSSYEKNFAPSFFNVNDKEVSDGKLKFSIISLEDIMEETDVITVYFTTKHKCSDVNVDFAITGTGIADSLTNSIVLNFVDTTAVIPPKHVEVLDPKVEPTCTATGLTEGTHCSLCNVVVDKQEVIPALGHEYGNVSTVAPTCTKEGYTLHDCIRCDDYYITNLVPTLAHTSSDWIVDIEADCVQTGSKHKECTVCKTILENETIPALGHTASDWITDIEADCVQTGSKHKECVVCKSILETETISALGHTSSDWIVDIEADCEHNGTKHKSCTVCNEILTTEIIPATGHTEVVDKAVSATCTTTGLTEGKHCSVCNKILVPQNIVAKLAHTSSDWIVDIEASCEHNGTKHKSCTVCDTILTTEIIPAIGHTEVVDKAVSATCTTTGLTEGKHCSVCDKILVPQNIVAKLAHTSSDWIVDTNPTCESVGTQHKECTVCKTILETGTISVLGHTSSEWIVDIEADCTQTGSKHKECTVCKTILETETISALGHIASDWIVDVEASCESIGIQHKECTVCKTILENGTISALGHTASEWIVDVEATGDTPGSEHKECLICKDILEIRAVPSIGHKYGEVITVDATCLQNGYTYHICADCGREEKLSVITAKGHTESDWITDNSPSCISMGSKHKECTVCKTLLKAETIPALNHTASEWIKDTNPTCESVGTQHKECTVCKSILETETIPALGHTASEWIVDVEASCEYNGTKHKSCTVCNEILTTEIIPATGHTEVVDKAVSATCTTTGLTEGKHCSVCDKILVPQNIVAKLAHTSSEWIVDIEADCTQVGSKHKECTVCKTILETETIPALGHTSSDWITDIEADCVQTGSKHKECTVCKTILETETISALGHTSSDWIVDVEASCEGEGLKHKSCTVCNEILTTEIIPATGHTAVVDKAVSATCTTTGLTEGKHCSVCDKILVAQNIVAKLNHTSSEWIVDIEADCVQTGSKHKECTVCKSILETETIPALGHTASEWIKDTNPTCESVGTQHKECTVCKTILETETISALGHTSSDWIVDVEASCESIGIQHKECTVCKTILENGTISALGHDYECSSTISPIWSEKKDGYDIYVCKHDESHTENRNIVEWETLSATVLVINGTANGKVSVVVEKGTTVSLKANSINGMVFDKWIVNGEEIGVYEELQYTVTDSNVEIVAEYKKAQTAGCGQNAIDMLGLVVGLASITLIFKKLFN